MVFTVIGVLTVSVWITRAVVWLDTPEKKGGKFHGLHKTVPSVDRTTVC